MQIQNPVAIFAALAAQTVVLTLAGWTVAAPATTPTGTGDEDAWFNTQILPLLRQHCYECHSHSSGKMKGGLALDWRNGWVTGGDTGPAVVPGKPDESLLIRAVRRIDPDLKMPPKVALAEAEVAVLVEWVRRGAPDPRVARPAGTGEWWSLKPLVRPPVPVAKVQVEDVAPNAGNPIDAFVLTKLREKNLLPSPPADRRTLIRRISFDLTGLPPTPEEVAAFIADSSPGAYERVVNRLLASPRYGERWARHWLDAVHFADTHGFEHDLLRPNAWRYRDYVIDALNRDTAWPRFIREQMAADVFYPDEPQLTAAMGFLGAGPYDQSAANTAPKMFEYLDRDDLVNQTMAAFVSATVGCARCHAHKFDPIPQEDYFALQAVFAGVGKGDIEYDADAAVLRERRRFNALLAAAKGRDANVLLATEHAPVIAAWEKSRGGHALATWSAVEVETFTSSDGATLKRHAEGTVEATGPRPERDTYTLTVSTKLPKVTALHLEVLSDPSLPKGGPGRADNGNFHLSEFEVLLFRPAAPEAKKLKFRRATADWDQDGWTIAQAIDGNVKTAWGIHPREGESHHSVFEIDEAIAMEPGARLVLALRQLHGGSHLIGRLRISATAVPGAQAAAVPAAVTTAIAVAPAYRSTDQRLDIAAYVLRGMASSELARLPVPAKVYAAGAAVESDRGRTTMSEPRAVHVLRRGDLDKPGVAATPGALSAIGDLKPRFELPPGAPESARRAALADWLADRRNPLTWRSAANRVWHHHFGRGLCDTPNDLGRMGGTPSHPELLDWLACELRDGPAGAPANDPRIGSLKHLHRLIVTSATYRQSSSARPDAAAIDADNRLFWRMERHRLDAESYRDAVLAVSGRLDLTAGGPGVQHFKLGKPVQATPTVDYTAVDWDAPGVSRRSIYRVVWRAIPDPFMESLDFPDTSLLVPTRGFSASPQQALAMMNNSFVLRHAEHLAKRAEALGATHENRIAAVWRMTLLREATEKERADFGGYATKHGLPAACRLVLNLNEFLFVD